MRIALAQLNFIVGDIENNVVKIIEAVKTAVQNQSSLIVFSELSLIGYPPEDLLAYDSFYKKQGEALNKLLPYSNQIDIIVGGLEKIEKKGNKPYYNTAFLLSRGQVKQTVHKRLLPDYDVFSESRFFEPAPTLQCIESNGIKIALTICEDIWEDVSPYLYSFSPLQQLMTESPTLIINIAASPYTFDKQEQRASILRNKCTKFDIPALYINQIGAQTALLFDGNSCAFSKSGSQVLSMPAFETALNYVTYSAGEIYTESDASNDSADAMETLQKGLVLGIRDYFHKNGFSKAILGSSGGIDSALVQALASQALGPQNVTALILPSDFNSNSSAEDAMALSNNLGNPFHVVPIQQLFEQNQAVLESIYGETSFDTTEENLQSRIRAVLLMAVSNKQGQLLLNTSNKSELAVGYGTLYGDMCGALSVIGDLYKTQVFALANYINLQAEIIPKSIIEKPPSAELRPNQKDSDSLPDYSILDPLLRDHLEAHMTKEMLVNKGYAKEIVERITRLVFINEHKRFQAPPVLKVSLKSFGQGRQIPLTAKQV